jgi:ligand-binding sensor domain-containing protein
VWIGTSAGLNRFRRNRLLTLPLQAVFNHPAIAPPRRRRLGRRPQRALHALATEGERRSVLSGRISALYRDPDGVLWAGNSEEVWSVNAHAAAASSAIRCRRKRAATKCRP